MGHREAAENVAYVMRKAGLPRVSSAEAGRILYLTEWKSALDLGRTAVDYAWMPGTGVGRQMEAVGDELGKIGLFRVEGGDGRYVLSHPARVRIGDDGLRAVLDHVAATVADVGTMGTARLVMSTYPMCRGREGRLLVPQAEEYKASGEYQG